MPTMTIADARAHLGDVIGKVRHAGERYILTAHGKPAVAVVPIEDLEDLEAYENEEDARLAREALADYNSGKDPGITLEELSAKMAAKHAKAKG